MSLYFSEINTHSLTAMLWQKGGQGGFLMGI
jgi:hypothetical protein